MKKWILLIVVLAIALAAVVWLLFIKDTDTETTSASNLQTATVEKGQLDVEVGGSGTVTTINDSDVEATTSDTIASIDVATGDTVTAGQKLVTLDNGDPIYAPFAGTITVISASADDMVNNHQVLMHITDYSTFKTVVAIDELDINKIQVGQAATIDVTAASDEAYQGTVTDIAAVGTNNKGVASFDVSVTFTTNEQLKAGMSAEANILTASKEDALYLPIEAVQSSDDKDYVMIGDQVVEVTTGLVNTNNVEITTGVSEGDTVQYTVATSSSSSGNMMAPGGGNMVINGDGPEAKVGGPAGGQGGAK